MATLDLPAYLDRLGLSAIEPSLAGVSALQEAQLRAIPFESVDPFLGRVPPLDLEALQQKLVRSARGGYCFELNSLLFAALTALGVPARRVLARVHNGPPEGRNRSHMAMIALAGGRRLLVDAGFGGPGALTPLDVDADGPQEAANGVYRLVPDARTGEKVVQRLTGDTWLPLFGFDEMPVIDADVMAANLLCSTWDEKPFPNHLMANAWSGTTRFGLFDLTLKEDGPGGRLPTRIATRAELGRHLTSTFGLNLDAATVGEVWSRLAANASLRGV